MTTPMPVQAVRARALVLASYWYQRPHDWEAVRKYVLLATRFEWLRLLVHDERATPADVAALADVVPAVRKAASVLPFRRLAPCAADDGSAIRGVTQVTGHVAGDAGSILGESFLETARAHFS